MDMVNPRVSFVVPVLNAERDIARCILSIRSQQFPSEAYELLIRDNGSTDRTQQIMQSLECKFEVIPNVTVSALRNRGAAIARGDYVAFIDADVEISQHWVHNALAAFKDPHVVASGCFPAIPPEPTWIQQTWDLHQRGRRPQARESVVSWLPSMNLIVRREDFLAVGGFNEELKTAEDVDLCYRIRQRGVILSNAAMKAIHWGEAPDLRTFWRKEVWRGIGNLKGVLSHGFRWDEVPSLGYPLYVILLGLLFCLSLVVDILHQQIVYTPLCLILLAFPPLLLALKTAHLADCLRDIPKLFLLYFIYGLARAYSMVKGGITLSQ
jgi:glycosyltransferase involved in cell wall biosynthesis